MILVYIETRQGKIKKASLETLSEAKRRGAELATEVAAVLAGSGLEELGPDVSAYGAGRVYLVPNPALDSYSAEAHGRVLADLIAELKPEAVFFSATARGKDLAPRLAARLGVSLASDVTHIAVRDKKLEFTRPIFAGKAFLLFTLKTTPQIATLRPNVFPLEQPGTAAGEVIKKDTAVDEAGIKGRVVELLAEKGGELDVTEAEVIVSGGRGIKAPENFELLKQLSAVIPRSTVGASRAAVDSGWIGHAHQVGQTGKTVSPNLYMAFGISGAIQHLAGMSSSKVIVAVNKDSEAPIFKVADYGIVGDLFEVIPALKDELKKLFE
ncbi:MAG: electron transfer flavoprotein subunit alpha/FixB family protein [Candidatus Aminicenantes bacterium]|nr:electron transfer flavoprotein subunit alpha/FixB family protein [Candidatus Aminicenantes bacterium]